MIGVGTTIFLVNPVNFGSSFINDYSMQFDGVDESLIYAGNAPTAVRSTTNFSISFWHKDGISQDAWWSFKNSSSNRFICYNNGSKYRFYFGIGANVAFETIALTMTGWHNVIFTFDGTASQNDKCRVYVDGVDRTPATLAATGITTQSTYENFRVMNSAYYGNQSGNMDELSIFDYTLNSTQASAIYNSGTPTDLDNTSGVTAPAHWWRMGDGSDTITTINDVGTTGGFNLTPVNMEAGDIVTDVP